MRYIAVFVGREIGTLGFVHQVIDSVEADSVAEAAERLALKWERIDCLELTEAKE